MLQNELYKLTLGNWVTRTLWEKKWKKENSTGQFIYLSVLFRNDGHSSKCICHVTFVKSSFRHAWLETT